ncbi:MAG: 50S ribosomal protein L10 [Candidatus Scalindua sp. AMX11]|nr:MAG: 50S ribosomal protein L10 [Candidatus Scalindua sp.]RZV90272.1 MAG: 50S ribosomal protein L10 [Candidatus Scalindua sp. SCAELEC01]TDE64682.1 MAG: 50S ribosomal protein L10 [Candidatus Scalindua sp. AMX11]GJQ57366.1 MAG: 50S ribosomal protein L10 [Candidatus Scalindua sp.]
MSKKMKSLIVEELVKDYKVNANGFVVLGYKGVNAQQADSFRRDLTDKEVKVRVVKNTLASIAFKEIGISELGQVLDGPSVVATTNHDPVELIKLLDKWSKKIAELKILGGLVDGKLLSLDDVETLATIPSRQDVFAQILFGINAPLMQLANVFNAVVSNIYLVLVSIEQKKKDTEIK